MKTAVWFWPAAGGPVFRVASWAWLRRRPPLCYLFFLIVGGLLPLQRRVDLLETTVLNLAQSSLSESNSLTCPDPHLRVLVPLNGQTHAAGAPIQLVGTTEYPGARRYQLEYRLAGNNEWKLIDRPRSDTRLGLLTNWETTGLATGNYEVRLSPVDMNNIRLANSSPCVITVNLTQGTTDQP